MKPDFKRSTIAPDQGLLLLECMMYLSVFFILVGLGFSTFYMMWSNSSRLRRMADDVTQVMRAGEAWRADIRASTGVIHLENAGGEAWLKIPSGRMEIAYRFTGDEVWRKQGDRPWTEVLPRVATSAMERQPGTEVHAWHWELALDPHGTGRQRPFLFSFEAVAPNK